MGSESRGEASSPLYLVSIWDKMEGEGDGPRSYGDEEAEQEKGHFKPGGN